jgi:hypothetical protein
MKKIRVAIHCIDVRGACEKRLAPVPQSTGLIGAAFIARPIPART